MLKQAMPYPNHEKKVEKGKKSNVERCNKLKQNVQ